MKLRWFVVLAVCTVLLVGMGISSAQAEDMVNSGNQLEAGAYGMLVVPQKGNFDTAGGGGGYLRYFFTENIALEGAVEYAQWAFSTSVSGTGGTVKGDLDVIPIMGTLQYHFKPYTSFGIYLGGGITGIFIDGSAKGPLSPGGDAAIDFDNTIGGHITGGLDWKLSDSFLFNLDGKYTWAKSKTSESLSDKNYVFTFDDMEMNNFTLRGGFSYKF